MVIIRQRYPDNYTAGGPNTVNPTMITLLLTMGKLTASLAEDNRQRIFNKNVIDCSYIPIKLTEELWYLQLLSPNDKFFVLKNNRSVTEIKISN